jgi:hypothetical protein
MNPFSMVLPSIYLQVYSKPIDTPYGYMRSMPSRECIRTG